MNWDSRQRAMLKEMGIVPWEPRHEGSVPEAPEHDGRSADPPLHDAAAAGSRQDEDDLAAALPASDPQPIEVLAALEPQLEALAERQERGLGGSARGPGRPTPREVPLVPTARRPSGVPQMDWTALRDAVAGCTACKLCSSRRNTVFGVGHPQADWMVVGEAPGEQEDLKGEPFVGQAGKLLDNMLRAVGLTREEATPQQQVFIANVLKCRPPHNRNPEPEEVAQCEPYLQRQVELVQPKIILAMGRFAVQSLLQTSEPIGRLRGRVHHYHGVPVIVTYHPAYLLRNLPDKAKAWEDLCLAKDTAAAAG